MARIGEITAFLTPEAFRRFGLPDVVEPSDGSAPAAALAELPGRLSPGSTDRPARGT